MAKVRRHPRHDLAPAHAGMSTRPITAQARCELPPTDDIKHFGCVRLRRRNRSIRISRRTLAVLGC